MPAQASILRQRAVLPFYLLHQTVILAVGWYVVPWHTSIALKYAVITVSSFTIIMGFTSCSSGARTFAAHSSGCGWRRGRHEFTESARRGRRLAAVRPSSRELRASGRDDQFRGASREVAVPVVLARMTPPWSMKK